MMERHLQVQVEIATPPFNPPSGAIDRTFQGHTHMLHTWASTCSESKEGGSEESKESLQMLKGREDTGNNCPVWVLSGSCPAVSPGQDSQYGALG